MLERASGSLSDFPSASRIIALIPLPPISIVKVFLISHFFLGLLLNLPKIRKRIDYIRHYGKLGFSHRRPGSSLSIRSLAGSGPPRSSLVVWKNREEARLPQTSKIGGRKPPMLPLPCPHDGIAWNRRSYSRKAVFHNQLQDCFLPSLRNESPYQLGSDGPSVLEPLLETGW